MKVYLVMQCEDDGYDSCPSCAFSTEEKADKYVEVKNQTEEFYRFYTREFELDEEEIPEDAKEYLSEYAMAKPREAHEFFAEAFAEYMTSKNPRPLAREFGKEIEKILKS